MEEVNIGETSKVNLFSAYRNSITANEGKDITFDPNSLSRYTEMKVRTFGKKLLPLLEITILILIFILCFIIRLFAVIRFESMIHEFDPYFNYRTTEYLQKNGFYEFWNWFDDGSWYPLGRVIGQTLYPGLMTSAMVIHTFLNNIGIPIPILYVCVFTGPLFGGLCAIAAYLCAKEVTGSSGAGLLAAFFTGISPSFLSRSVAGSYDNECVAICAMVFAFYTWVRALRVGTIPSAVLASFGTFYLVTTWGAYVFVINIITIHIVALALLGRLEVKHQVIYCTYYVMVTMLCLNVPFVNFSAVISSEHMSMHGVFIFVITSMAVSHLRSVVPTGAFEKFAIYFVVAAVSVFVLVFSVLAVTGKTSWSARSLTLLDPTYAAKYIPIVASVSEHQPPVWGSYYFDLHLSLLLAPCGIWLCLKRMYPGLLLFAIYGLSAVYFSGVMVRLMLVLSPAACILSGIGASYVIENLMRLTRSPSLTSYFNFLQTKKKVTVSENKTASTSVAAVVVLAILACLCISYTLHSTWAAALAYSHPSVVSRESNSEGKTRLQDDFREAYSWFAQNTNPKARLMCWWDYGYQTTAMGNRTVLVDNNTWNNTHIATVGLAFASNEENAYQIVKKLDVDYIFVVFGGQSGYQSDDVNKFLWMVRIASGVFPMIQQSNYLTAQSAYTVGEKAPEAMLNSLLYKLSYYRFHEVRNGYDAVRRYKIGREVNKLEYFEEVYTTTSWIIRIFKVKRQPNRDPYYHLRASSSVMDTFSDTKMI